MTCAKHHSNSSDSAHLPSCLGKMEGWRFCRISQFLSHTHPEICIDDLCKRSLALSWSFLSVSIALQPPARSEAKHGKGILQKKKNKYFLKPDIVSFPSSARHSQMLTSTQVRRSHFLQL